MWIYLAIELAEKCSENPVVRTSCIEIIEMLFIIRYPLTKSAKYKSARSLTIGKITLEPHERF